MLMQMLDGIYEILREGAISGLSLPSILRRNEIRLSDFPCLFGVCDEVIPKADAISGCQPCGFDHQFLFFVGAYFCLYCFLQS